ncbi:MAG: zf-HC2 domain-containing protein [Deltaproteobacteria bacterium]|nr:zf-HC2 domain-containing protein [Deltaproteobacteria bacterium]
MHTCEDMYNRASAFHDGDLLPPEREAYEHHLEVCPDCANFYHSFRATIDRARDVLSVEPPPGLAEELVRSVREKLAKGA